MKEYRLTVEMENQFIRYLIQEEKAATQLRSTREISKSSSNSWEGRRLPKI